jgi:hypothetical protein
VPEGEDGTGTGPLFMGILPEPDEQDAELGEDAHVSGHSGRGA